MNQALSRAKTRVALMQELEHAVRRSSGSGAIFGQAVASYAGISSSDHECIDFLNLEGRVTAGRLAEVTGLTTGAITGMVDRLEKAGFVRRERDVQDRRKVFIAIVPENIARIAERYEPIQKAMRDLWSRYSDAELQLLIRFADESYKVMLAATEELKATMQASKTKGEASRKPARSQP
jgi:DNA-binding MarR family transcriptional regulator